MKVTKKSILEKLALGLTVRATAHVMGTVEDIPKLRESLQTIIAEHNDTHGTDFVLEENENYFSSGSNIWYKPKVEKVRTGYIEVYSKECAFVWTDAEGKRKTSYFSIKDIQVIDSNSFYINTGFPDKPEPEGKRFVYEILI